MTTYSDKGPKPEKGRFICFDHISFYVGNAKQAASYYTTRMGFEPAGYQGLETGNRRFSKYAVRQNKIVFVFISAYQPNDEEHGLHLMHHGDGVKDVAFQVEDLDAIFKVAKERGAEIVRDIWEENDQHGTVRFATIKTYGDTTHTLVERSKYRGDFLPGYAKLPIDPLLSLLPATKLNFIDHCVGNQPDLEMEPVAAWYERILQFHRLQQAHRCSLLLVPCLHLLLWQPIP